MRKMVTEKPVKREHTQGEDLAILPRPIPVSPRLRASLSPPPRVSVSPRRRVLLSRLSSTRNCRASCITIACNAPLLAVHEE
jgi:hypothetical protein